MSDDRVSTMLETVEGNLTFQEYFVRERHQIEVRRVRFEGAQRARPATGYYREHRSGGGDHLRAEQPCDQHWTDSCRPGIRAALRQSKAPVAAVSPIVGGAAVSGPAGALMKMMGWPSTIAGVAKAYEDFLDVLVADRADEAEAAVVSTQGLRVHCTNTIMNSLAAKRELARFTLEACASLQEAKA